MDRGVAQKSSNPRFPATCRVLVGYLLVSLAGMRGLPQCDPKTLHLLEDRLRHSGGLALIQDQPGAAAPLLDHPRVVEDLRDLLVPRLGNSDAGQRGAGDFFHPHLTGR